MFDDPYWTNFGKSAPLEEVGSKRRDWLLVGAAAVTVEGRRRRSVTICAGVSVDAKGKRHSQQCATAAAARKPRVAPGVALPEGYQTVVQKRE